MGNRAFRLAAVDLGAESGRVVVGTFDGGSLSLDVAHRFPNAPVALGGTLHWDVLRLFGDIQAGLRKAAIGGPVASVSVDTWGVDFGLLDARGRLLANPVHYRDRRTDGIMDVAFRAVAREEVYRATGIQMMPINTLFQLLSMAQAGDPLLGAADRLLFMPDLFHHFLAGCAVAEYTIASTSQCLDPFSRDWARPLLEKLGIPTGFLAEVVPPGTPLGRLQDEVAEAVGLCGTQVIAAGSHDTASAVVGAPLRDDGRTAYLSSGTWSLLGLEVDAPVVTDATLAANLTNEGGVAGRIRLLRNVMGLWLVQRARAALRPDGDAPSYEALADLAETAPPFTAFVDPDDERFLHPSDMADLIRTFCRDTGQPVPTDDATLFRVILESLALRYAWTIEVLMAVTGTPIEEIRVVGGGASHRLLCRLTAGATGLPVRAGPIEAAAIGNLAVQAITAGELSGVGEARELVARSFPTVAYDPEGDWTEARARFASLIARRTRPGPADTARPPGADHRDLNHAPVRPDHPAGKES